MLTLQGLSVYFKTGIPVYVSVYKHACRGVGKEAEESPFFQYFHI